jgi:hypothetical protein
MRRRPPHNGPYRVPDNRAEHPIAGCGAWSRYGRPLGRVDPQQFAGYVSRLAASDETENVTERSSSIRCRLWIPAPIPTWAAEWKAPEADGGLEGEGACPCGVD